MRGTALILIGIAALATGCGIDHEIGPRYRAEKNLWESNREFRRLSIRPELVEKSRWEDLALRFENHAAEYGGLPAKGEAGMERRRLAAQGLVSAARIYAGIQDTTAMIHVLGLLESYAGVAAVAGEAALAEGQIAENQGNWDTAVTRYGSVLDEVEPDPRGEGPGRVVLDLPLRIARIVARELPPSSPERAPYYVSAGAYYRDVIEKHAGTDVALTARARLADVAADMGSWTVALRELEVLESEILGMEETIREPSSVRFARAMVARQREGGDEESRKLLQTLLRDYPDSRFGPRALIALATVSATAGQIDQATDLLDQVREEYPGDEGLIAEAMLIKGQVLEGHNRWPEAQAIFRSLVLEFPMTAPGLRAPMEIVSHYERVGDDQARSAALKRAEKAYRESMARYPRGPVFVAAHQNLALSLSLQGRHDEAVFELIKLGESLAGRTEGANYLIAAARMAASDLADTTRAAEILERTGALYASAGIGRWASSEATRLREEMTR